MLLSIQLDYRIHLSFLLSVWLADITYNEEGALDGGTVVHGSEVVLTQLHNHELLKEAVAHEELLGRSGDVPVVVEDAHACEASHVHLQRDVLSHLHIDVGLARGVGTHRLRRAEVVEAHVSNFVHHYKPYFLLL